MRQLNKCKVSVFGEVYSLITDEAEEQVIASARLVDTLMRKVSDVSQGADPKRVAVLVALQLAGQVTTFEKSIHKLVTQEVPE